MGAATSTLLTVLTKAGVNTNDAQVLDAHFAAEPAFMEGLETVAEVLAHKSQLTGPTPPGDPWRSIYSAMRLGQTMTKLGLVKKKQTNSKGQRVNGYIGIKLGP